MPLWVCPPNFFEGALAIMYKGHDSAGEAARGDESISFFMGWANAGNRCLFLCGGGLIGTLCVMQANQLVESVTTVITTPAGIENTLGLRL